MPVKVMKSRMLDNRDYRFKWLESLKAMPSLI